MRKLFNLLTTYDEKISPASVFSTNSKRLKNTGLTISWLFIQFLFLQTTVYGQMFFTVELQDDQVTYLVKVRSENDYNGTLSITNNAQLSFVVPTGGFKAGNIQNVNGSWVNDNNVVAPEENPEKDYLVFNLSGNISDLEYRADVENELFSFENVGECTGTLDFITEDDPFFFNSKNINIGNQISVLGAGFGNAFSGTYGPEANCLMSQGGGVLPDCELVDSVITQNPTQCGLVGGIITIYASIDNGLQLQYSINGGESFQTENTFTGLVSGRRYEIWVSDEIPSCTDKSFGVVELGPPADAIIVSTSSTPDSCMSSNGTLKIEAVPIVSATALEYSIDEGTTWLENDGFFTGLAAGTYQPRVRAKDAPCFDETEEIVVAAECVDNGGNDGGDNGGNNGGNNGEDKNCVYTFVLDAQDGVFTVSLISDTTITGPLTRTPTAQVTLKVPTGSFEVSNFTSLVDGANFQPNGRSDAPTEAPEFDYLVFGLTQAGGTQAIEYTKGVKVPLFSFENSGQCTGGQVFMMENFTDPFYPPNSQNANVSQQITVAATGSDLTIVCQESNMISDCGTNLGDDPGDGEPTNYPTDTIYATLPIDETTTLCIGDELNITTADLGTVALCNAAGTIITSLTDGSNCIDLTTDDHFNQTETICIVHADATDATVFDTTILVLCPAVSLGNDLSICSGASDTLRITGGTGNFTWTTTGNISCTDCPNPVVAPTENTQYIVTSVDGDNCMETDTIMVNVLDAPAISEVMAQQPTNCQENGEISITATGGTGNLRYSIDGGTTFQTSSSFTNLGAGTFEVMVANQDESCSTTWPQTVALTIAGAPTIVDLNVTPPNGCRDEQGSISITATSENGSDVIEYSIDNGTTWQTNGLFADLDEGDYNLVVRLQGSDCEAAFGNNPVTVSPLADLRVTTPPGDQTICSADDRIIQLELNDTIDSYTITGGLYENDTANINVLTFEANPADTGSTYTVTIIGKSGCTLTEEFTLTPGEDTGEWDVDIDTTPAGCDDDDGAINVTVNETNNGFTFCWEPNKASGPMRTGLSPDSTYNLTITGSSGCTLEFDNLLTGSTCEVPSCNIFTGLDTLNAFVVDGRATACLPIGDMDLSEFQFLQDGQIQEMQFGECMQSSILYDLSMILETGQTPFNLREWSVNGDTLRNVEFQTLEELAVRMNQFDFQANWVVNQDSTGIKGFSTGNVYGELNIQTNASSTMGIGLTTLNTMYQSIILSDERGVLRYTIKDPMNDCEDDLYIKVQGENDGMDTLELVTTVNTPINNQCLNTDETGTENLSIRICNQPSVGILNDTDDDDACFGYMPNTDFVGKDFFCIELCNGTICDTTLVNVTINPEGLVFFTGFSPNNDGVNDVFTIRNIENFPDNKVLIYNRWGNRIFKADNYKNDEGWTGMYGEGLSPDGVYFYVVKVTINGEEEVFSGPVMLSR
ncbi:MAG: gliding motility-associated C-terminal domain-containing protein [Bacteroidota bacterium]